MATKKSTTQKDQKKTEKEQTAQEQNATVQAEQPTEYVQLSQEEFEKVKAHIEALQKEKDEAIALAQRLQADFDNFRKRNCNVKIDSFGEGTRDCIRSLLPTLDNFDRALQNTDGVEQSYVDGIRLVQKTMMDALAKLGMSEVPADGEFDANLHNAVMREAVEDKKSGDIIEVFQKGYAVEDKILRYSMVKVAE